MSEEDRTPTMAVVEMPPKPLVDRRMRYFVLEGQANRKCADRTFVVFVASIFAALGIAVSPWFSFTYVATVVVGYFWAKRPMRDFKKQVKGGLWS